jgi:cytochrome c553
MDGLRMAQRDMYVRLSCLGALCFLGTTECWSVSATDAVTPQTIDRVWATTPDADHGKVLYLMHCRQCHGRHAWGDGPRSIPSLAGQREKYLVEQLTQFAVGQRAGQSMHETMQRSDLNWAQAVRDLAAYLSIAPRSTGPEYAESNEVSAGKRLYQLACRDCHGGNGEGTAAGIPAIGGQHYRYLAAQLVNFSSGHRDPGEPRLPVSMGALSRQDILDIANYVSRLSYLTDGVAP